MGLRQQALGKPALVGPSVIILSSSLRCVLVSLEGLPLGFFDFKPSKPLNKNALNHNRIDSSLTLSVSAITA